uniref:Uncharacterized protein n=1 Tax=Cacopsylla melanoneura TaxID=428564 RepID=A0A8D8QDD0_9HEMI
MGSSILMADLIMDIFPFIPVIVAVVLVVSMSTSECLSKCPTLSFSSACLIDLIIAWRDFVFVIAAVKSSVRRYVSTISSAERISCGEITRTCFDNRSRLFRSFFRGLFIRRRGLKHNPRVRFNVGFCRGRGCGRGPLLLRCTWRCVLLGCQSSCSFLSVRLALWCGVCARCIFAPFHIGQVYWSGVGRYYSWCSCLFIICGGISI